MDSSVSLDLVDTLNWFFFELFVFNYVEDVQTGLSYRLPLDQSLSVYVEVSIAACVSFSRYKIHRGYLADSLTCG